MNAANATSPVNADGLFVYTPGTKSKHRPATGTPRTPRLATPRPAPTVDWTNVAPAGISLTHGIRSHRTGRYLTPVPTAGDVRVLGWTATPSYPFRTRDAALQLKDARQLHDAEVVIRGGCLA
jgi:hypothetical protein